MQEEKPLGITILSIIVGANGLCQVWMAWQMWGWLKPGVTIGIFVNSLFIFTIIAPILSFIVTWGLIFDEGWAWRLTLALVVFYLIFTIILFLIFRYTPFGIAIVFLFPMYPTFFLTLGIWNPPPEVPYTFWFLVPVIPLLMIILYLMLPHVREFFW